MRRFPTYCQRLVRIGKLLFLLAHLLLTGTASAIQLLSPVGGEVWVAGSQHTIVWDGQCANGVDIRLFANGSWQSLAHVGTSESWTWNPVCPIASDARIWVGYYNPFGPPCADSSASFTISGPMPSVVVTSPFGGEQWAEHSSHAITWNAGGLSVSGYEIWLSTNNFASHTVLVSGLSPLLRSWMWNDVSPPNNNLKIRVVGQWDCGDVSNTSDDYFEVIEEPSITDLNMLYRLQIGESAYIHWTGGPQLSIWHYDLYLSRDGGATYPEMIRDNHPSNSSTFYWTVTGPEVCDNARVKVIAFWLGGQVEYEGHDFTIEQEPNQITISTPASGAAVPYGSTQSISWQVVAGHPIASQTIYFLRQLGGFIDSELLAVLPASARTWQWLVQQPYGDGWISISAQNEFCQLGQSVSVEIVDDQDRSIQVLTANSEETWYEEECRSFNWAVANGEFTSIDINLIYYPSSRISLTQGLPGSARAWLWDNVQRVGSVTSYVVEIVGHVENGNVISDLSDASLLIPMTNTPPSPRYVDANAAPGGNGHLSNPFRLVQDAIEAVPAGGTVIITSGTYNVPSTSTSKAVFLKTRQGVSTLQ